MATASPQAWLEEELICSICLQMYTDPVILNCKHSFCKVCIEKTWKEAMFDTYPCPECRAEYKKWPHLQRNFKLASIIEKYNVQNTSTHSLLCNYCPSHPRPAVKTCLKCEASMCLEHLRHHTESTVFKSHLLVDPTADVSQWKCTEHQELLKIYCKEDKVCVCTLCTVFGKHKGHNCGSISEGEKELRAYFNDQTETIRSNIQSVQASLRDLQEEKLKAKDEIKQKKMKIMEKNDALRKRIEREEREMFEYLDREEKRVIVEIDAQIRELSDRESNTREYLSKLSYISKEKGAIFIQMLNSKADKLRSLSKPFPMLPTPSLDTAKLQALVQWLEERVERNRDVTILLYGQTPLLDRLTAHPQLVVSNSRRNVTLTRQKPKCAENPGRFDCFPQVICADGVNRGLSYWEVEVPGACWRVGVCYRSLRRKGPGSECSLGMNNKSWSVCSLLGSCTALHNGNKTKLAAGNPARIGVLVEFEAGIISFYSVSDKKLFLLYTFQQQTFTEALYPALTVNGCDECITMCDLSFPSS
ncbi:E3 ubiquitin/ISG15 ligase TRIM25-like [Hemiscyllium ocellatum]|uniref:E3 ubiquitin/ISG15 ligase TRIM25-like n=1 Tax=Hemiscyllium ocellatum TaxID=170820 RepID=UPI00296702CF|nr:E3 ubiquitin/ISG15 ligase TRIM25-like [Hemiscyllium ocellatum]